MVSLELRSHTLRHTCAQDKRLPPAVREPAQAAGLLRQNTIKYFASLYAKLILYCEIILHSPHTDFIEKSTLLRAFFCCCATKLLLFEYTHGPRKSTGRKKCRHMLLNLNRQSIQAMKYTDKPNVIINSFPYMPKAYFIRESYFTLRGNISLVPSGTNITKKDQVT